MAAESRPDQKLIGIFGGTFDPIHFGHLRMAEEVLEATPMEELRFIPARHPPHRSTPSATPDDRTRMLELALHDGNPKLVIDRRELLRSGPSYTLDTLRDIRNETGQNRPLALILGCDAFQGFEGWHRWREIPDLAHLIVITRPGYAVEWPSALDRLLMERETREPLDLEKWAAGCILLLNLTPLAISASGIRDRIREGRSIRYLTQSVVIDWINRNKLYRHPEDPFDPQKA